MKKDPLKSFFQKDPLTSFLPLQVSYLIIINKKNLIPSLFNDFVMDRPTNWTNQQTKGRTKKRHPVCLYVCFFICLSLLSSCYLLFLIFLYFPIRFFFIQLQRTRPDTRPKSSHSCVGRGSNSGGQGQGHYMSE